MRFVLAVAIALMSLPAAADHSADAGNPESGRQHFRACVACHSLEPGRHMTGPSLAEIWGREAGTIEGFARYSDALEDSDVIWDAHTLDAWLADPEALVPGNSMTFSGIADAGARRDLIAFLREVSGSDQAAPGATAGAGEMLDLKTLDANNRVVSLSLCGDTYSVTAETGEVYEFWEFNLRFKTDSSEDGPRPGQPVIIPAGMRGDRAYVVFASPAEISPFVTAAC